MSGNNYWGYLREDVRHEYCVKLADLYLSRMSPLQIIQYCPPYYGPDVSDAHKEYLWDQFYEESNQLDDYTLARKIEDLLHPEGQIAESYRQGKFVGNPEKLN